ncbi:TonB family protein [Mongoliimonas terrestris]|uniref:TonB family protein n=1 Tax=Mongoliimonas terrestris TaxID=1709001 RepID=UPI000949928C|nr:TonB family protein [Mongoliimonas terrestris]
MTAVSTGPFDGSARSGPGAVRWIGAFTLVAALHGAGALSLLASAPDGPSVQAPEAAVMIDLPPDLALPPAESVESIAAEGVDAEEPTEIPTEAIDPVEPTTVPVETMAEALPETVETAPVETTVAAETATDAVDLEPSETATAEAAEESPAEAVEDTPADVPTELVEAPPSEVAEAEVAEAVGTEAVAPAPPVAPKAKPVRRVRPRPAAKVADKPRRVETAAPAPSRTAVEGQRASGSGRPDPDALAAYGADVRARIMRQRRTVSVSAAAGARVTVRFTVSADGGVSGVSVARSSGDPALDIAAVAMVQRASPLPAIPSAVGRSSLSMSLPVRFDR